MAVWNSFTETTCTHSEKFRWNPALSTEFKKGERFSFSGISTKKVNLKHFIVRSDIWSCWCKNFGVRQLKIKTHRSEAKGPAVRHPTLDPPLKTVIENWPLLSWLYKRCTWCFHRWIFLNLALNLPGDNFHEYYKMFTLQEFLKIKVTTNAWLVTSRARAKSDQSFFAFSLLGRKHTRNMHPHGYLITMTTNAARATRKAMTSSK